jgi:hypothetical protein
MISSCIIEIKFYAMFILKWTLVFCAAVSTLWHIDAVHSLYGLMRKQVPSEVLEVLKGSMQWRVLLLLHRLHECKAV